MPLLPPPGRARAIALAGAVVVGVLAAAGVVALVDDGGARDDVATGTSSTRPSTSRTTDGSSTTASSTTGSSPTTVPSTSASTTTAPAPTSTAPGPPSIALRRAVALESPSALVQVGAGGPVLVTTLDGRVHRVDLDAGSSSVVLDLRSLVSTGGERGLLGLAVDPPGSRMYVNFTNVRGDTEIRSWPLRSGAPVGGTSDGVLHLEIGQPFANHNGGNLVFGPDGMLWIGTGDGGQAGDPGEVAQDPGSLLGKMLRVRPDPAGGVQSPADNPAWGGRSEVWGIGLRNPWRYSFDRATGLLWIADVGQNRMEEVSVIGPGADRPNFGWDDVEGTLDFEGTQQPGFTIPVITYRHDQGCSVTGGHVYRGAAIASLFGWYVFSDFCGGWIRAVPADDPGRPPVELVSGAGAIVSFGELADGELVVLTRDGIASVIAA